MSYVFDAVSDRYRNTENGRYVNRSDALAYVERSFDASRGVVNNYASAVAGGQISPADWRNQMREEIKGEYIRQYMLGRGGRGSMTDEDWGSTGGMLSEQFKWLDSFADEVAAGDMSEGEIAARARMYVNSAREAYERGHYRAVRETKGEAHWDIDTGKENCDDCIAQADRGWIPIAEIDIFPGQGQTQCKTNCGCSMSYR